MSASPERTPRAAHGACLPPHPPSLSHALSLLAGPERLALCEPAVSERCRPVGVRPLPKGMRGLATWLPRGSHFFTLIKAEAGTVLYCHETQRAYHAAPCAWLAADCPPGAAFLCQWCVDACAPGAPERGTPHLLVFDVLHGDCPDVGERGRRLREMSRYLPLPLCVVQWVGDPEALDAFVPTLPHAVECLVSLGPDPLQLYRHMRVQVPPPPEFAPVVFLGDAVGVH